MKTALTQKNIEQLVFAAKNDDMKFSRLVEQNTDFILKVAGNTCRRYIDQSSDEWSIALSAFYEAVMSYAENKGSFYLFAQLVIKRRLTDHLRRAYRMRPEISVPPEVFSGNADEDDIPAQMMQSEVLHQVAVDPQNDIALEIEIIGTVLLSYGFSFMDLTECSPKAGKTKRSCAAVIRVMLNREDLLAHLRHTKTLPIKILEREYGLPRKILERHRKYIIAAIEIVSGDYPYLAEYLKFISDAE